MDRKTIRELREAAIQQGWRVEETKKGLMFIPADKSKPQVLLHHTAKGGRSDENAIAQLRRSGLIWKGR